MSIGNKRQVEKTRERVEGYSIFGGEKVGSPAIMIRIVKAERLISPCVRANASDSARDCEPNIRRDIGCSCPERLLGRCITGFYEIESSAFLRVPRDLEHETTRGRLQLKYRDKTYVFHRGNKSRFSDSYNC